MRALLAEPGKRPADLNPDDLDEVDGLFLHADFHLSENLVEAADKPVIAVLGAKGGTGKTTIAVLLAGTMATRRRRVGVLDLDPLDGVNRWSGVGAGLPFPTFAIGPELSISNLAVTLGQCMSVVDLLIVDTPSQPGIAQSLALQIADLALIPVGPASQDLVAVEETIAAAAQIRQGRDGRRPVVKLVPYRQDARTRLAKEFGERIKHLKVRKTPPIEQRIEIAAAADRGRLVQPKGRAGKEFKKLARHVLDTLRGLRG